MVNEDGLFLGFVNFTFLNITVDFPDKMKHLMIEQVSFQDSQDIASPTSPTSPLSDEEGNCFIFKINLLFISCIFYKNI